MSSVPMQVRCALLHLGEAGRYALAMPLPALRNLDIMPIEQDGQTVFYLNDHEGFVEEPAVLSPVAFFVASLLDGVNEITDIQYRFAQQSRGTLLVAEDIMKVVDFLDQHGFLQSDAFIAKRRRVVESFTALDARPAYAAGRSYPDDEQELREFLNGLFAECGETEQTGAPVRGLIAPHIDFERGRRGYAHAYRRLQTQDAPKTAFVFGVAHAGAPVPFILTRKHFDTPLGRVETDTAIVDQLAESCSWDPFDYEILHRTEHSIEFQAVMLAYLYGPSVRIVPILCGATGVEDPTATPGDIDFVAAFLTRCREMVSDAGGSSIVIAGADLAHVGRRFGDSFDITDPIIKGVETRDREDLAFATAGDARGFYRSVMQDDNSRHVCGLGCIYATLMTLEGNVRDADFLHYDYAPDPAGGIVSFAAIALT